MTGVQRQTITYSGIFDGDPAPGVDSRCKFSVPYALRFVPDEVILRNFVFTPTNDPPVVGICYLYSELIKDQILFPFSSGDHVNAQPGNPFELSRIVQNGQCNFQIQNAPDNITGPGPLEDEAAGVISFALEFIRYDRK